jgi:hypothetical protein
LIKAIKKRNVRWRREDAAGTSSIRRGGIFVNAASSAWIIPAMGNQRIRRHSTNEPPIGGFGPKTFTGDIGEVCVCVCPQAHAKAR